MDIQKRNKMETTTRPTFPTAKSQEAINRMVREQNARAGKISRMVQEQIDKYWGGVFKRDGL